MAVDLEPFDTISQLIDRLPERKGASSEIELKEYAVQIIPYLARVVRIMNENSIDLNIDPPSLGKDVRTNIVEILDYFGKIEPQLELLKSQSIYENTITEYQLNVDVGKNYEFSDDEYERLQTLISEIRDAIVNAESFDDDHRQRLLRRLEKLQQELHKKVRDLDVFIGTILEIGAAAGKFGKDTKPLLDRMREFGEIVTGVFRRGEKLPPGPEFPLLFEPDNCDD